MLRWKYSKPCVTSHVLCSLYLLSHQLQIITPLLPWKSNLRSLDGCVYVSIMVFSNRWSSENRLSQVAGYWLFSLFVVWLLLIRIMFVTNGFAVTVWRSLSLPGDQTTQQAIHATHVSNKWVTVSMYSVIPFERNVRTPNSRTSKKSKLNLLHL